ncbi:M6 family metalloprotease domain-containing protein [Prosthecobacter sp.]|uniref:M6 family metalloprotease domain-containing protein n=1 Tax=Prosthecobacter sp. TaxID=1965333 RepID=UPI002AB8682A|nr:M6 family metalloprotease domain-containing protein [Prosthecobacter sp.]MDZ4401671.1 M6 family metalloprotease domain-containing protein [Prosthecobacter sp.]
MKSPFFVLIRLLFLLLAIGWPQITEAVPASALPFVLKQPDGTAFSVRVRGSDVFSWYETLAGYPINQDPVTGEWRYLDPAGADTQTSHLTSLPAHEEPPPGGPWSPAEPAEEMENAAPAEEGPVFEPPRVPLPMDQGIFPRDSQAPPPPDDAATPPNPFGTGMMATMCVKFADMAAQPVKAVSEFQSRLFNITAGEDTTMTDYYWKVSRATFRVTGGPHGVVGWYTVPGTRASYAAPNPNDATDLDQNRVTFVRDAVTQADGNGFDFGPYDTNNDGYVDCLALIAQGLGEDGGGGPNAFWPHQSSITPFLTNDLNAEGEPVYVSLYFITSELLRTQPDDPATPADETVTVTSNVGVFCHEYAHALGVPDLYDTKGNPVSAGLGQWSLMARGCLVGSTEGERPTWMDAWSRKKLGWATVVNVTTNTMNVVIPTVSDSPTIYRMWTNGNPGQQYFLVENRRAVGFDSGLPGSGLLIYHVDEAVGTDDNKNEWIYRGPGGAGNRTTKGHYKVALEQADGKFNLERVAKWDPATGEGTNQGDGADAWVNGQVFDATTVPSSRKYNIGTTPGEGDETSVAVRNISNPDSGDRSITADLIVSSNEFAVTTITVPTEPVGDVIPVYQTMTQFEGTAYDDDAWGTGVWEVQVYLRELKPDGRYWKFTTNEWQSTYSEQQQKGVAAGTGGLNWARPMHDPALTDGVYEVKARSVDMAGLVGPFVMRQFRIQRDMTAPEATISSPGASPLSAVPTMTGTATDNVAIQEKRFSLYSHTQGKWLKWSPAPGALDSGTFSPADHILTQNNGTSPWTVALPPLLPNGDYQFFVEAIDTTNQSSGWRDIHFTLQVAPKVALTGPLHGSYRNSAPVIEGTAQPGAGATLVLNRVTLVIQRGSQWWDGDSWENSLAEVHADVSGGTWSYPTTSSDAVAQAPTGDGGFTVTVTATDSLGRVSLPVLPGLSGNTTASFVVDTVPPLLVIESPTTTPPTVITGPPLPDSSALIHGSAHDSSGRPEVTLHLKRVADDKYWSGMNWFTNSAQAVIPGHFGGDDLGSQTDWKCSLRLPRLGIREGSLKNGSYEVTAVARDAAGNESTATSTFTVDWNPVWLRPQDHLVERRATQTPPIAGGTVGSGAHQTYSPRAGPSDNVRNFTPTSFGLDAAGNTYVFSHSFDGQSASGIFQRLGAGGWRRERTVTGTPGPGQFDPWTYTESWDGVNNTSIPAQQGYAICDFAAGSVDAAGNTQVVYNLDHTNGVTRTHYGILMVKFDAAGNLLWRSVLESPSTAGRLMPTPDGGAYLVLSHSYLQSIQYGFSMVEVVKVSSSGSFGPIVVHGQLDGGDFDPAVWATHLFSEVDAAGDIFHAVTEDIIGGTGPVQVLYKHNASGAQLAKLEVDPGETPEQWLTMKTDTAGDLYVASMFDVSETDRRICLSRYNSTLQLQWRAFGPANSLSYNPVTAWMPQIHVGTHGITLSYGSPGQGYYSELPYEHGEIARFSTSGDLLWTRGIAGTQATVLAGDSIQNMEVDASGNVLFLAVFNEPMNGGWFNYGKISSAGDLQFIKAMGSLAEFFPHATTLYQGTQMLALNLVGNNLPPPDDLYNTVLLDNPANQLVPVTLDPNHPADLLAVEGSAAQLRVINRGSAATYQWRKKDGLGVPQNIPGATLDRLIFNSTTTADAGEYSVVVANSVDAVTSRTATVTVLAPVALDVGLDTPGRTWTTGGQRSWVGFAPAPSHDNVDAAMPNNLGQGESSWLETTVTGPVTVSFWWKSSNPSFSDFFDFSVDGDSVNHIGGDEDWTFFQHALGAGDHTLRWTLSKSSPSTVGTSNTVFLDQVVIAGTTSVPLADALDTTGLTWTTSADALAWTGVTSPSHDGVDSATSGTVGNSEQSFIETTVTGPGTLSFWWKVSSESGFDSLKLTVDGAPYGSASGEVDWTEIVRPISAGTHVIRWSYEKDSFFAGGQDRVWVDQVVFAGGSGGPEIVVEQPASNGLTDNASTVDFGTALPGNNTVRTFTIRNTGNAQLNGLVVTRNGTNDTDFALGSLGQTSLNPGDFTTFTVTFTPGASDARTAALHIQSNDADENTFDINLMGSGGVPVTSWRQQHFLTTANTGDAADDADPDHDGKSNLLEFATGAGPNTASSATENIEPPEGGLVEFLYTRNKLAMAELTFQVEWADNLLGPWSSAGVVETILSDNGLIQQVRATFPAGTSGRRFAWLKVTRP